MARVKSSIIWFLLLSFSFSTLTTALRPLPTFAAGTCPSWSGIGSGQIQSVNQTSVGQIDVTFDKSGWFTGESTCTLPLATTNPYPNAKSNTSQSGGSQITQPFGNNTYTYISQDKQWIITLSKDLKNGFVWTYNSAGPQWDAHQVLNSGSIKSTVPAAPVGGSIISTGNIGGTLEKIGNWQNPSVALDQDVALYYQGNDSDPKNAIESSIKTDKGTSTFSKPLSQIGVDPGHMGLEPGNYTVMYKNDDKNSSCGGGAGGVAPTGVCAINWVGKTEFTLQPDGKAKILSTTSKIQKVGDLVALDKINIGVEESVSSPLDGALSSAMVAMAGFIEQSLIYFNNWNYNLLIYTPKYVLSPGVEGAWTNLRNLGITLLVLALLIIAFANVLGIDLDTYGLNRMIPRIIIAIIFAYFSWLIVEFFFDFTAAIQAQAVGLVGGKFGLDTFTNNFQMTMPQTGEIVGKIGVVLLFIVLFFFILVCSVILWVSLLLRVMFLAFLLAVAPLAMIFSIMPFTETLYKRWWGEFWKWMFMGPVAIAIIGLGYIIASGFGMGAGTIDYSTLQSTSPSTNIMMGLAIFAAAMVMAASLPLQWGGKAMQSWRGLGKNAWNKSGGAILRAARDRATERPRDFLAKRKANVEGLKQQRAAKRQGEWAQKYGGNAFGRKLVLGTNEAGVRNMQNAAVDSFKKEWGGAKLADLQKAATRNGNNPFAIRALADLAQTNFGGAEKLFAAPGEINEMGNWNDGIKDDRKIAVKKQAATALYASMQNSGFRDMIFDKNMGLAEYMQHETGDVELKKQIRGKLAAKAAHEKDAGTLGAMRELGETKDLQEIYHGYTSSDWKAIGEKGSARYKGEVSKDLGTLAGSTGFVPSQENINRIIQPEAQGEFKKQVTEKCNIPLPDAKPAEVKVNGAAIMDEAGNPVMSSKVDAEYIGTRHFFESALKNVSSGDTNKETVTIPNNQGPTPGAGPNESSML